MIIEQLLNFNFWLGLMPGWIPLVVMGTGIGLIIASSLIKIFLPIEYRIVIIVVYFSGIIIALSGAYIKGRVDVLVNSKKEIEVLQAKQEQITQKIVEHYIIQSGVIKETNEKILNQVNTKDDRMCTLPESFVRLHDNAAQGTVPDTSSGIDGTASGIALSEAERVIIENYGKYQQVAEQLRALQEWVAKQKELNP